MARPSGRPPVAAGVYEAVEKHMNDRGVDDITTPELSAFWGVARSTVHRRMKGCPCEYVGIGRQRVKRWRIDVFRKKSEP